VILVAGNLPTELSAPDDTAARMALLQVLAQAIRADTAPNAVRAVIMDSSRSVEDVADLVLDTTPRDVDANKDLAKRFPEMDYVDWRLEVLSLATIES
jgi:cytochrome c556